MLSIANIWIEQNFECFSILGAIFAIYATFIIYNALKTLIVSKFSRRNLKSYGRWAVITGATDGIGKSYARQLASRGLNIVLISRNESKLRATAEELKKDFGIDTCVIEADYIHGWSLFKTIEEHLRNKEIGILVNNVGILVQPSRFFLLLEPENLVDTITVNINSAIMMTKVVLPGMLKRRSGAIVNISSVASLYPCPFFSCYGATKAAVTSLSKALFDEFEEFGITLQCLTPAVVKTKLVDYSDIWDYFGFLFPDSDTYCIRAINTLGVANFTTGYWSHSPFYLARHLPKSWISRGLFYFVVKFLDSDKKYPQKKICNKKLK